MFNPKQETTRCESLFPQSYRGHGSDPTNADYTCVSEELLWLGDFKPTTQYGS